VNIHGHWDYSCHRPGMDLSVPADRALQPQLARRRP
jgi:hypothetical protein